MALQLGARQILLDLHISSLWLGRRGSVLGFLTLPPWQISRRGWWHRTTSYSSSRINITSLLSNPFPIATLMTRDKAPACRTSTSSAPSPSRWVSATTWGLHGISHDEQGQRTDAICPWVLSQQIPGLGNPRDCALRNRPGRAPVSKCRPGPAE